MPTPRPVVRMRAGAVVLALCATTALAVPASAADTATTAGAHVAAPAGCLDPDVPLSVEERRLTARLPDAADPTVPAPRTYARTVIEGGGFGGYTAAFTAQLCRTRTLAGATALAERSGEALWDAAVRRAQSDDDAVRGDLPASDDRPLYWTRVEAMAVLRQWDPRGGLTDAQRTELVTTFDKASRGMFDIDLPRGRDVVRVIVSGFDVYTLDGGTTGPAPGTVGNNIRHGNPSGATALSLDGTTYRTDDGRTAHIEAYTLPVSYREFAEGYLEDTVGPFMKPGPRQVDASLTVSQAGGSQFNLEQWNARYHGVSPGNDGLAPCARVGGVPQLALDNPACTIQVVDRWGGGDGLTDPPQWTTASLPVAEMIAADTGADVPRPPGDTWPDPDVAFGVVWNTSYTQFTDCASPVLTTFNSPPPVTYPPATPPVPPAAGSCSYSGGGGNYLSNESAYRNTLLRDRAGLDIPAGHIHTPDMQHFETTFGVTDPTFDAWRTSIAAQARNLVHAVVDTTD
ncbi:hypothetical protein ACFQHV_06170 [Promicromonospora thailandica]|uniref:Pyrrolidone-carboxylate peptidase n=1 Tax=Promicromonospora thailandica TaxID=765201 RepID=A0A9X2G468_9MICO|nr:hypothetical protein [Promicromonospora thailandica]MCP2266474.1 hypothetical protein [Promicromonospora thailandica]